MAQNNKCHGTTGVVEKENKIEKVMLDSEQVLIEEKVDSNEFTGVAISDIEKMTTLRSSSAMENNSSSDEAEEVYDLYTFNELQEAFDVLSSKFE